MTKLAHHLGCFLREHLPRERGASANTCDAYAYAFQLLVCFAAKSMHTQPSLLEIDQVDAPLILAFLEHLESERRCSSRTRNARVDGAGDPLKSGGARLTAALQTRMSATR